MHAEVEQARQRSGWPTRRVLAALSVSATSYYRWRREASQAAKEAAPFRPVQAYEALTEEKERVLEFARKHAGIRHRELAWRMVDEDVAYLSPSTVYRILKEANLVCPWRRRTKRRREDREKARRVNERWSTDLLHLKVGDANYYLVCFLDDYSRYAVHHELLLSMDGQTLSVAAQAAVEKLPRNADGTPRHRPEIRSDNGSGFVSQEFRGVLKQHGLSHQRIKPHCPEENGLIERAYRTFREALEGHELNNLLQAQEVLAKLIRWYNEERLHSALGYLRPKDYYEGDPERLQSARREKLRAARHNRKETNLRLRQRTFGFSAREVVASSPTNVCQNG